MSEIKVVSIGSVKAKEPLKVWTHTDIGNVECEGQQFYLVDRQQFYLVDNGTVQCAKCRSILSILRWKVVA